MGRGGDGQGVEAGKDDGKTHKCYQMDVSKWVCKASRRPELREHCCGMLDLKLQGPGGGWESHLVFCLSSIQCCRDKLGAHECRFQSFSPLLIPSLGVLGGLWCQPLGCVSSFGGLSGLWFFLHSTSLPGAVRGFLLSPHSPTTLNHVHLSTSCFHPSIASGIWLLTQLPAFLRAPGLAPELQSIPGLG